MCRRSRVGLAALLSLGVCLVALRPSIAENAGARAALNTSVVHFVPSLLPMPPPASIPRKTDALRVPKRESNRSPPPKIQPKIAPLNSPMAGRWKTEVRAASVDLGATSKAMAADRRIVRFREPYPPGSIVIVNSERALYHVGPDQTAVRYSVAIGAIGEEWTGVEFVTQKRVNPTWYPVPEFGKEIRDPVPGGDPTNPLGARALYLGRTLWRIHGTPAVESIGQAVSNGCIRMRNEHVAELYDKVLLGAEVYVVRSLSDPPPTHRGRKILE